MAVHGLILWGWYCRSVGILTIRMGTKEEGGRRVRVKVVFYLHAILQTLSVLLATVGAVMSIQNFNNSHQRLGLALYLYECKLWLDFSVLNFNRTRERKNSVLGLGLPGKWKMEKVIATIGVGEDLDIMLYEEMEGRKMGMILSVCIMVVAGFATGTTALREDAGAIPPSPMEGGGVAVGVPAALAVLASMVACFF
ncbi:hypothetical protein V6N13_078125 [Hibiscus sabdariffa]